MEGWVKLTLTLTLKETEAKDFETEAEKRSCSDGQAEDSDVFTYRIKKVDIYFLV